MRQVEAAWRERDAAGCQLIADVLSVCGRARLRVTGSSMLPSVLLGDVLTIERLSLSEVRAGDIVVFIRNKRLFAHRAVNAEVGKIVTRGDSLNRDDAPVHADELLGRVTSVGRKGSEISLNCTPANRLMSFVFQRSELLTRCLVWLLNHNRCRA